MAIIDVVTPAEKERRRLMALIEQRDRLRGGAVSPPSPASPPSPPQQPFDPSQEGVSMAPSAPPVPGVRRYPLVWVGHRSNLSRLTFVTIGSSIRDGRTMLVGDAGWVSLLYLLPNLLLYLGL